MLTWDQDLDEAAFLRTHNRLLVKQAPNWISALPLLSILPERTEDGGSKDLNMPAVEALEYREATLLLPVPLPPSLPLSLRQLRTRSHPGPTRSPRNSP
jgi:hypothetical protein